MQCPLCHSSNVHPFSKDKHRNYQRCVQCQLIFVPERFFLSKEEEKARYDLHENNAEDAGYLSHLNTFLKPILKFTHTNSYGLDFGSGPQPVLAKLLRKAGYNIDIYDLYYAPHPEVFNKNYDLIISCEVIEHVHKPATTFERLFKMLRPNGVLAIMTQLYFEDTDFKNWYYKNDKTHVCFFSHKTFKWIAQMWNAEIVYQTENVILLKNAMAR